MASHVARCSALLALLTAVAVFAAPAGASPSALPTLYVAYTMNCTFSIVDDSGRPVTVIAPGTYQISIRTPVSFAEVDLSGIFDMTACKGFVQFKLTGPGVSAFDNLGDGDNAFDLLTETFQPSSTYVAQDLNQPSVARLSFTTAASGSASGPAGSSSSSTSSKGSTQQPLVGSAAIPFRGALDAIVFKNGKLSLSRNGKAVTFLKSGRWTFSVDDESTRAGFSLQLLHGTSTAVTSMTYTGSHDVTMQLKPGRWFFFTPGGRKSVFFVTS